VGKWLQQCSNSRIKVALPGKWVRTVARVTDWEADWQTDKRPRYWIIDYNNPNLHSMRSEKPSGSLISSAFSQLCDAHLCYGICRALPIVSLVVVMAVATMDGHFDCNDAMWSLSSWIVLEHQCQHHTVASAIYLYSATMSYIACAWVVEPDWFQFLLWEYFSSLTVPETLMYRLKGLEPAVSKQCYER